MKILQIILGIILLLPGICSVGVIILFLPQLATGDMTMLLPLWLGTFLLALFGYWIIRSARNRS